MKIAFIVLVILHGVIHLLGFIKAFKLAKVEELSLFISKPFGIIWLLVCLIFVFSAIQFIMRSEIWWATALIGIIISQILIFMFWQDAKFGTIANVIILVIAIIAFGNWNFNRITSAEISNLFSGNVNSPNSITTQNDIVHLPIPVQKWLVNSGVMGKEKISTVRLKQKTFMKMKQDQEDWSEGEAFQYYTIDDPAFIWTIDMRMNEVIDIAGRDSFIDGKGKMLIKLFSLINIVNEDGPKIDTGAMQRFLGEIVWFPSAALSSYIQWEAIDSLSAGAAMNYNGTEGSGVFYFKENGDFEKFVALRYMGNEENAKPKEWIVTADKIEVINGVRIPTELKATWKLENTDWTWLKIKIENIKYEK